MTNQCKLVCMWMILLAAPACADMATINGDQTKVRIFKPPSTSGQTAIIAGTLKDVHGQPVAGYPIILENASSEQQGYSGNIGFTSETGEFAVAVEQPGNYTANLPTAREATTSFDVPPDLFNSNGDWWRSRQDIGVITLPENVQLTRPSSTPE